MLPQRARNHAIVRLILTVKQSIGDLAQPSHQRPSIAKENSGRHAAVAQPAPITRRWCPRKPLAPGAVPGVGYSTPPRLTKPRCLVTLYCMGGGHISRNFSRDLGAWPKPRNSGEIWVSVAKFGQNSCISESTWGVPATRK